MTESEKKIRIISAPSKEKPYVIIYKPHGLPSAPLSESDTENALSNAAELFPEINNVHGRKEIEKGLIHRLDTVTAGVLLIATTQEFFDKMIQLQNDGKFIKYYKATCDINAENVLHFAGFPRFSGKMCYKLQENEEIKITSFFRPFGIGSKEVRPVTEDSGKAALKKIKNPVEYTTDIKIISIDKEKNRCEVLCKIARGYRHQVRCHLSWIGLPVVNDAVYNANAISAENEIEFEAVELRWNG